MALTQRRPDHDSSFFSVYANSCSCLLCLWTPVCFRPFYVYSKGQKGKRKKSPLKQVFLKRNDILDRPLDCVIFLKLVRVDYYLFFPCISGHWFRLLFNLTSNHLEVVSLTYLIPLQPGGGSCWSAPSPSSPRTF